MTYSPSPPQSTFVGPEPIGGVLPAAAYQGATDQLDLNLAAGSEPARINLDRAAILEVLEGRGMATVNETSTALTPGTMLTVSAGEGVAVRVDTQPVILRAHFAPR